MTNLLARYRAFVVISLAAFMAAVGAITWLQFPESIPTATAQETITDVCDSVIYPDSYDILETSTSENDGEHEVTLVNDFRANRNGFHNIATMNGTLLQENIILYSDRAVGSRSGASNAAPSAASYTRAFDDGEWGAWDVRVSESGGPNPAQTRQTAASSGSNTPPESPASFCGLPLEGPENIRLVFRHEGEETINGIVTDHYYHSYHPNGGDGYQTSEFWLDSEGLLRQVKYVSYYPPDASDTLRGESTITISKTYSGWGEENIITAPVAPTPEPSPTPTGTEAPVQPDTPVPPNPTPVNTPTPAPPPGVDAWLEPDPETITFDGQWRQFTIRGTGLDRVDFSTNVINYPNGPNSTGAVEVSIRSSLPTASDACQNTYYTGYRMNVGDTFHLVGCQAGSVILRLEDPANDYAIIRDYTVTVSGGP